MKIGIIGAGQIGGTLTRRLTVLGQKFFVATSRGPETPSDLAPETGAPAVSVPEAVRGVGLMVVTIPQTHIPTLPAGLFADTPDRVVVVDTGNYYPRQRDGRIEAIEAGLPESRWVEQQIGRPVIKAFNNIYARHLFELGRPAGAPGRIALPVAGDDDAAKTVVLSSSKNWALMASMPAVWTSPGGSSPVRRSTPRISTPTVCGAACTKRAKTALRNGAAPRTAPVGSPLLLERALAGGFRPAANHGISIRFTGGARHSHPWGQGSCAQPQLSGRASIRGPTAHNGLVGGSSPPGPTTQS